MTGSTMLPPRLRWALLGAAVRLRALRSESREPTLPVSRLNEPWWRERLAAKRVALSHRDIRLLFIGDSLTHNWEISGSAAWSQYAAVWERYYGHRSAANLGYAGDMTGTVLWRLHDGEIDGVRPRLVVVLIGINDIIAEGKRAEAVVANISAIIAALRQRLSDARILLLGLLPNRVFPWIARESARVNNLLAARDWTEGPVTYVDIGDALKKDGRIDPSLFSDALTEPPAPVLLHPTAPAYDIIAQALEPTIAQLLEDDPVPANVAMQTTL